MKVTLNWLKQYVDFIWSPEELTERLFFKKKKKKKKKKNMLRPGHIRLPKDEAAEAERAAGFARKQQWKELPGNRYTPEELRAMSDDFKDVVMFIRRRTKVMFID